MEDQYANWLWGLGFVLSGAIGWLTRHFHKASRKSVQSVPEIKRAIKSQAESAKEVSRNAGKAAAERFDSLYGPVE